MELVISLLFVVVVSKHIVKEERALVVVELVALLEVVELWIL